MSLPVKLQVVDKDYDGYLRWAYNHWTVAGDTARLKALEKAIEAFDYSTIESDGAIGAIHEAKSLLIIR